MDVTTECALATDDRKGPIMGELVRVSAQSVATVHSERPRFLDLFSGDPVPALHVRETLELHQFPMRGNFGDPVDAGRLRRRVGIETSRDCLSDDRLLLL